jgi:cation diffusion facilitator CzcD-associated flavoprotein CzcO
MKIAVIGSGVSGIATAKTLKRFGHDVVIYEKSESIGGVWATAYPGLTLQNLAQHYRFTDFPWPFKPDAYPTAEQVRRYLDAAVAHFGLDIRTRHEVVALTEQGDCWDVTLRTPSSEATERFGFVVVATGHYSEPKPASDFPGRDRFRGEVLSERELTDLERLRGKRVAVVGFGKTAVDIAALAAERDAQVTHVFRAARWLLPRSILGIPVGYIVPSRLSTRMALSWVHPHPIGAALHRYLPFIVTIYWRITELVFRAATGIHPLHLRRAARQRIAVLEPWQRLTYHMRATVALAPDGYVAAVVSGRIVPVKGEIAGFGPDGLLLADGTAIPSDLVVLAIGSRQPAFGFLPEACRKLMTANVDGTQLYRHLIHPGIKRLAFAGFNHGYLHVPTTEVASVWLAALIDGDLELPDRGEIEQRSARVAEWKRAHILLEPNRAHGIGMRIHQYLDVLLGDLGLRTARKHNVIADALSPYWAEDYAGVADEYLAKRKERTAPIRPLPFDT